MIIVYIVVWLVVKRWWLGCLISGLIGAVWVIPNLSHLTGAQRGVAFAALGSSFVLAFTITAALYGLRHLLTKAWRVIREKRRRPEMTAEESRHG